MNQEEMRAYLAAVHGGDRVETVIRAYRDLFARSARAGELVLADLAVLCRETRTSFDPDPYRTAFNEGMRGVLQHIKYLRAMTPLPPQPDEDDHDRRHD